MFKKRLDEIADVFSGVHISRYKKNSDYIRKPVIRNKFINDDILDYNYEYISDKLNTKFYSKRNDILISLSEPNNVSILHEEGYIITMYFAVVRLKEGYNPSFIYHLLKSNYFLKELYKLREGGSLRIIKVSDLKKIKLDLPDYELQRDYGEFLDLIDNEINLEKKLIDLKKDYKESIVELIYKNGF